VLDGRRYAVGWIATRDGDRDDGAWQWAGTMAIHELTASSDGTLGVSLPTPIRVSFTQPAPTAPRPIAGTWHQDETHLRGAHPSGFGLARMGALPTSCLVALDVTFAPGTRGCGVALRLDPADPDVAYYVRLEPDRSRMVFDRWPRPRTGDHQWQVSGDVSHAVELEREVDLAAGVPHRLEILVDGSAFIAYLDGRVAMSGRMLDRPVGDWGVFVSEGSVDVTDVSVRVRGPVGS
jgi:beta-fructofuranosidase